MSLALPQGVPRLEARPIGATIEALCALGNRYVGSAGELRAREFLRAEFEHAGLRDVGLESVLTLGYRGGHTACSIGGEAIGPSTGLQFSAGGEAHGDAVYLGDPQSADEMLATLAIVGDLTGRIAVLHSYWPWAFCAQLIARGIAGLVVISHAPEGALPQLVGQLYPHAEPPDFAGSPLPIPGVTLERQAGERLLVRMAGGAGPVAITHEASYGPVETANLVGELRGSSEEWIVIGAHYDTQRDGVGAHDNATGLAALVEIARQWAGLELTRSVRFVAFADEESALRGSTAYCRAHAAELDATVAMFNLDALAWACPGGRSILADPAIADHAVARASEVGWVPEDVSDPSAMPGADLIPFIDAGVPACWFWRFGPQHLYYHCAGDTPELLDLGAVAEVATVTAHVALSVAASAEHFGRSRPGRRWLDLRPGSDGY